MFLPIWVILVLSSVMAFVIGILIGAGMVIDTGTKQGHKWLSGGDN